MEEGEGRGRMVCISMFTSCGISDLQFGVSGLQRAMGLSSDWDR